ncbi:MAG: YlxR family protein [Clostridiales bacterium]|nr:YlxR family protein [Clostridiales bacterium]MDD6389693.1 YlxR family protein [Bacillota bacterium]MDY5975972.1 YlxR family protein [Anaerovoracaceae bacterium]
MKEKKVPMRRCVGCMESRPKKELIRIAGYEGEVSVDITGRAKGRGAYICRNADCLKLAIRKNALKRNLEMEMSSEQEEQLIAQLESMLMKND